MPSKVLYTVSDGMARITMNEPDRRNALSGEMAEDLVFAIKGADADDEVRVMILSGEGDSFSAGGDLAVFAKGAEKTAPRHYSEGKAHNELFRLGSTVRKPMVAAVDGHALGGGCGLAAMCHLTVASEEAKFGTTEIKVGMPPLVVQPWIRRAVGHKNTLRLMLTGEVIDAKEAREIGLVQAVVPAVRLYDEATALAEKISGYSPLAINLGLDAFYNTEEMDLLKSLDYLNTLRVVSFLSEDLQEGARAFIEKRSPEFTGQ